MYMDNKKKITIWKLVPEDFELDFQEIYNQVVKDLGSDTDRDLIGNHFCDNAESYLEELYGVDLTERLEFNQDIPDKISNDFLDWLYDGTH